ncbi:unnamed protein product [Vitrella brassicaformis CCMP3155]|uniref:Uncharacterized protein n=1 Tax=Vitrella brassicaformis (strain CCMP3155) TaxID=1169540 RepID=A0A0G4H5M6_VITBC|nr:unnamed protein product [Vitrella brassicaformis CCMP3155]|eukprot:CEM38964.1 unnamed protein product [Vitrella brassicaformis CCMP3155]
MLCDDEKPSLRGRTHICESASVFGQSLCGAMAAAASSSSAAAADLPQPQMPPSSRERYKTGTRVWMMTANREKGEQEWVKADVYRTEETGGGTRVSMREVEGRENFVVVVPREANTSPHRQQVHDGFILVERRPRHESDGNTAGQHIGLFDLSPDVERDVRVSEAYVKKQIDAQLVDKGLKDILSYDLPSVGHLLQLLCIIQHSGEWAAWEPIIRVAVHQGRGGGQLPIELGSADVEGVGSRAVFDGRCEALRQLSLIGRHLDTTLERDDDGEECLGGSRLTIRPPHTLPANHPFRNGFDPKNPVCRIGASEFASVRDAVLDEMREGGSKVAAQLVYQFNDAPRFNRLRQLATQPPPIWGCRTISTRHWAVAGSFFCLIVLHGDQPGQTFEAHIFIYSSPDHATASLWTTERPVDGREGAARFPETVTVVQEVMGDDAVVAFGSKLDVSLPPAAGGGGQGGEQTTGPAAAASSSSAAGPAMGYHSQHNGGQGGGAGGDGSSSSDLLQKIRSMRSVASQLVSDLDGAERTIASQADSTLDGASAGSLSTLLETLTKQLAEIADHDPQERLQCHINNTGRHTNSGGPFILCVQVPISVPLVSAGVSSSSAAPAAAASAAAVGAGDGGCGDGNRGEKRKAAASLASAGDDGGEGDMAADDRRAVRRRREQTAKGADGGSMMGEQ